MSLTFHQEGIPFLISAQILRSRGLGQVDVVRLKKDVIEVGEIKASEVGVGHFQRQRLRGAMVFLSGLLGKPSKLIEIVG